MEQDLFKFLPSEIILIILLKLPVRTIAISKCVRKSWRDLLKSDEFVKSHFSTSAAALAITWEEKSNRCAVFELENVINAGSSHDHHVLKHVTNFYFPHTVPIQGSANGMLLLVGSELNADILVCNPISREYIELRYPRRFPYPLQVVFGFGASKITGQHKVVQITKDPDCHRVYTLGTGSWRRVEAAGASFKYNCLVPGAFVNGNLHWFVADSDGTNWISWFDLETECFSTFSVPGGLESALKVSDLRDCLCVCDFRFYDEKVINIWLMKEYGDEKSWTKECVINLDPDFVRVYGHGYYNYAIEVSMDGDILMTLNERIVFYYSNKKKTGREIRFFDKACSYLTSALLTPSFHSLKRFPQEIVISF